LELAGQAARLALWATMVQTRLLAQLLQLAAAVELAVVQETHSAAKLAVRVAAARVAQTHTMLGVLVRIIRVLLVAILLVEQAAEQVAVAVLAKQETPTVVHKAETV